MVFLLQWGRNFFVTEITIITQTTAATPTRFNGAVTFSLRKLEYHDTAVEQSSRFNGAVTFSLRKLENGLGLDGYADASMGP